jgi:ribosomal protein S18 acetylase RimI-like enzyme
MSPKICLNFGKYCALRINFSSPLGFTQVMSPLNIRSAQALDLNALHRVIERAYRGETARKGWTHEADLLQDTRTDIETLESILKTPDTRLLVAEMNDKLIGCVQITNRGQGLCYLGLLCIDPDIQAKGLGRKLLAEAEHQAQNLYNSTKMEMTVIEQRSELLAYYIRRGYVLTNERRDFPVKVTPSLFMKVLTKSLG